MHAYLKQGKGRGNQNIGVWHPRVPMIDRRYRFRQRCTEEKVMLKDFYDFPVTQRQINKPATVQKPEKAIISRGSIPITTGILTNWR